MATKLKKDFIKLLEKDAEFRYAVAGYIGLADISKSISKMAEFQARAEERLLRLEEAVERLEAVVQRLAEAQARTDERLARLEEAVERLEAAVQRLTEAQARTEERLTRLEEAVARLVEAQARTDERLTRLEEAVERLAEAQAKAEERLTRLEAVVQRLAEAQARTDERVTGLEQAYARVEVSLHELAQQVGKLSDTIGFGLEDIARVVLPGWLSRHEGIEVGELTRTFFEVDGEVVEINLYGEGVKGGERVVVLGESRSRIYEHDVKEFDETVEKVKRVISHKVYKLLFGYWIHPSAQREAAGRGLMLIASYMR